MLEKAEYFLIIGLMEDFFFQVYFLFVLFQARKDGAVLIIGLTDENDFFHKRV